MYPLPIRPMEPLLANEEDLYDGRWPAETHLFQVKWDGVRAICWQTREETRMFHRSGRAISHLYPEIAQYPFTRPQKEVILDGELIVLDRESRPHFPSILRRERARNPQRIQQLMHTLPVVYMVFDLLCLDGRDLRSLPLEERQKWMQEVLNTGDQVQLTPNEDDGMALFGATRQLGLEGIVVKARSSPYLPGKKHRQWFKLKHTQQIAVHIGGMELHADGRVKSFLVGLPNDEGRLTFVGQAGSGLTVSERQRLVERLRALTVEECPFSPPLQKKATLHWVHPQVSLRVRFLNWSDKGHLRSPVIEDVLW